MPSFEPSNLLVLMSDQHNRLVMGCAGHPDVKTPNLDALAARGTRFANAYTNSPICVPSRAAMATGRYPHQIGVWDQPGRDPKTSGSRASAPARSRSEKCALAGRATESRQRSATRRRAPSAASRICTAPFAWAKTITASSPQPFTHWVFPCAVSRRSIRERSSSKTRRIEAHRSLPTAR